MPEEFGPAEDFDQEEETPIRLPQFPTRVLLAGIAWIAFGGLNFLSIPMLYLLVAATPEGKEKAATLTIVPCVGCVSVLFGVAFVYVGVQSVRGAARDTFGNAIGSIVFGVLNSAGGLIQLTALHLGLAQVISGVFNTACGMGLLAAGVLALAGRDDYRAWRKAQQVFDD